jgi:hypothetical protein
MSDNKVKAAYREGSKKRCDCQQTELMFAPWLSSSLFG